MANVLLFDNQRDLSILYLYFDKVIHSPESKRLIVDWTRGAWKALRSTHKQDTIVCWYDFQAIILYWLGRCTGQQRNIICINILLKNKPTWKNRIIRKLYKQTLLSPCFKATVTSMEYGKRVKEWIGYNGEFTLLHDLYFENYRLADREKIIEQPNTVFCGGSNGRDWPLMIRVARAMPQVKFHLVLTRQGLGEIKEPIPENVTILYDISLNDFVHEMCKASIVCNPLDTEAPAGLIVMFRSAANDKPIIATKTVTTQEYIKSGERGILVENTVEAWCNAICEMLENRDKATDMAHSLHTFLREECNEIQFVHTIQQMLP